jgi:hypothetical protein
MVSVKRRRLLAALAPALAAVSLLALPRPAGAALLGALAEEGQDSHNPLAVKGPGTLAIYIDRSQSTAGSPLLLELALARRAVDCATASDAATEVAVDGFNHELVEVLPASPLRSADTGELLEQALARLEPAGDTDLRQVMQDLDRRGSEISTALILSDGGWFVTALQGENGRQEYEQALRAWAQRPDHPSMRFALIPPDPADEDAQYGHRITEALFPGQVLALQPTDDPAALPCERLGLGASAAAPTSATTATPSNSSAKPILEPSTIPTRPIATLSLPAFSSATPVPEQPIIAQQQVSAPDSLRTPAASDNRSTTESDVNTVVTSATSDVILNVGDAERVEVTTTAAANAPGGSWILLPLLAGVLWAVSRLRARRRLPGRRGIQWRGEIAVRTPNGDGALRRWRTLPWFARRIEGGVALPDANIEVRSSQDGRPQIVLGQERSGRRWLHNGELTENDSLVLKAGDRLENPAAGVVVTYTPTAAPRHRRPAAGNRGQ